MNFSFSNSQHIKSHYSLWRNQRDWLVPTVVVFLWVWWLSLWPRSRCAVGPFVRRSSRSSSSLGVHSTSCERPVCLAGGQLKCGEVTPPGRQKFSSVSGFFPVADGRACIGWKVEQLVGDDQCGSISAALLLAAGLRGLRVTVLHNCINGKV